MKKAIFAVIAVMLAWAGVSYSETVNPASNALADSDATAGTIVYRNSSNASTVYSLTVSNDITVPAGSIDTTKITGTFIGSDLAADCIDSTKISAGSIYNADVNSSAAIDSSKISGTWLLANLADDSVDSNKIVDGEVYADDLADGQIDTTKFDDPSGTVEDSYILCVTGGKIGRCVAADGGSDTGKYCSCGAF